ncbi:hypothetical protein BKA65DRAFT_527512 [Rhexocercosporidium sp. MPI-PUGE-AT-0058]|nr:hypothetical protein BKA65DRAFT_527512 [Rhexocercosporidium sp. MPI-PUGE-AT-0058]
MASSVIGKSAESRNEFFVLKPVGRSFYALSRTLTAEFAGSRRLRIHVDCNETEDILVYPYFRDTLLAIIQNDPNFAAIQGLHARDWIHIINWTSDSDGQKTVSDVALGDFDFAFKSEGGKARETPYAIGNAMWRSPEGQTGRGVTRASEILSFGLVCIYTLGGGEFLLLNDYKVLAKQGISAEQEILTRHFTLGQFPKDFTSKSMARIELDSAAQDMISGMTNLDPACRTTIDHVLSHCWWQCLE